MITIELYQSPPGRKGARAQTWRWRATNQGNQKKMAMSSEAYTNRTDALAAVQALFGPDANIQLPT